MKKPRQLKSTDIPKLRAFLLKKQKGLCPICQKGIKKSALDHHHKKKIKGTGLIRGVLCNGCNIFLAKSENNCMRYNISQKELPNVLRNIADYLEKPHLPYIHPSEKPKAPILTKASYNKLKKVYSGKAKFPEYRTNEKGTKNLQKLTKPLERMFDEYGIEPTFYKQPGENNEV